MATYQNPREIRQKMGMNQSEFWSRIGVTQSGGSRYESGRSMPRPVKALVDVVHVYQIDLSKINETNAQLIRAILSGELEEGPLLEMANQAKALVNNLGSLSDSAMALSRTIGSAKLQLKEHSDAHA